LDLATKPGEEGFEVLWLRPGEARKVMRKRGSDPSRYQVAGMDGYEFWKDLSSTRVVPIMLTPLRMSRRL